MYGIALKQLLERGIHRPLALQTCFVSKVITHQYERVMSAPMCLCLNMTGMEVAIVTQFHMRYGKVFGNHLLDFLCGISHVVSMEITSWNVNSVRTRLNHVLQWWDEHQPDVLCLQETKVVDELFPLEEFTKRGLHCYVYGQKSYNGVALISKTELTNVQCGFSDEALNEQKRFIAGTLGDTRIINVYCPQGSDLDSPKFVWKEEFYQALRKELDIQAKPTEKLLICGDFNIAPDARDVHDADKVQGRVMFTPQEHTWLNTLKDWGLQDTYRLHEQHGGHFSWWDYRQNAVEDNRGWRIDQLYATAPLAVRCVAGRIDKEPRVWEQPSDHVPITATFV